MISQVIKLDNPVHISNLILWSIALVIFSCMTIYLFIKFVNNRSNFDKIQKENAATWVFFFFILSLATLFSITWRFFIIDIELAFSINGLTILIAFTSMIIKTINVERGINHSGLYKGYYFSIISILTFLFMIFFAPFFNITLFLVLFIIMFYVGWSLLPGVFLYLAKKTVGEARNNSLKIAIGIILNIFGMSLQYTPQSSRNSIGLANFFLNTPYYDFIGSLFLIAYPIVAICGTSLVFIGCKVSINSKPQ